MQRRFLSPPRHCSRKRQTSKKFNQLSQTALHSDSLVSCTVPSNSTYTWQRVLKVAHCLTTISYFFQNDEGKKSRFCVAIIVFLVAVYLKKCTVILGDCCFSPEFSEKASRENLWCMVVHTHAQPCNRSLCVWLPSQYMQG